MKCRKVIALFCFAFIIVVSDHLHAQEDSIRSIVNPYLQKNHTNALVVGIIHGNTSRFYRFGSIRPDTSIKPKLNNYFEIGSITKVFTTMILQDQINKGRLKFDKPAASYLPDSLNMPTKAGKAITLKHLATHTAGLPKIDFAYYQTEEGQKHQYNPYSAYDKSDLYQFLEEVSLKSKPGKKVHYSNMGMALLGHILEISTGKSYKQLIAQYTEEMGMPKTATELRPREQKHYLQGYNNAGLKTPHWDFKIVAPAGAIRSTPKAMMRFAKINLGQIETPYNEALNQAHQPRLEIKRKNDTTGNMGLGWMISGKEIAGDNMVFHAGGTYGFSAFLGLLKSRNSGVILMANTFGGLSKMGIEILKQIAESSSSQ